MIPEYSAKWLAGRGWDLTQVYDVCWLDCPIPGFRKVWRLPDGTAQEICLCAWHAVRLEQGEWAGDYIGAPLPEESVAADWPWLPLEHAVA